MSWRQRSRTAASGSAAAPAPSTESTERRNTWCIDNLAEDDGRWWARGWALGPDTLSGLDVSVDGVRSGAQLERLARPDIEQLYPDRPGSAMAGLRFPIPRDAVDGATPGRPIRLSVWPGGRVDASLDYFFPGFGGVVPSPESRWRVHGGHELSGYLLEGFSAFVKIEQALLEEFGRSYASFESVLDWGVGCGRFSRYFEGMARSGGHRVLGIDIDQQNVDWCREHLGWLASELVTVSPPTDLARGSVDLIIGVSVFTHLREADMRVWLAELARLVSPTGVVAVTTLGEVVSARLTSDLLDVLTRDRFLDAGPNHDIDGAVDERPDYYRNVMMTGDYIRRVWSEWFDVASIRRGWVGNQQDLVLLRPRR